MRGARLEALDELDLLGQHRLLALELRLLLLLVQRALLLVEFVIAGIGRQRAAVDLDDLVDDAVDELAIVRGHQQRALVALQELLQPDQAFEIEMVARLVQQHHVGPHQQNARQRHAHLPAAGERADVAVHHLLAEAEARQRLARAAVERIAVEFLEAVLHLAIARDDVVHLVGLVRIGHGGLELLQLGRHDADRPGAVHHLGHGAAARHLADVLAEIADGDAAIERHLALVGQFLARDHPEQRGLAGPVRADEADLLALLEGRGGFDEEDLVADLLADVIETDHWGLKGRKLLRPLLFHVARQWKPVPATQAASASAWPPAAGCAFRPARWLRARRPPVAGAGKADADLIAAEHGIFALRRRVLLVEDLALPAAVGRG